MNAPTLIIVAALTAIAVYTVVSYRKKLTSGCCGAGGDQVKPMPKAGDAADYLYRKTVLIDGMHCENCAARVANAFQREEGLMAKVSLAKRRADVYGKGPLDDGRIRQIVARAGYMVREIME